MPRSSVFSVVYAEPRRWAWHRLYPVGPDGELVARIDKVRKDLDEVKVDIETRRFLMNLVFANGRYCQSCSPLRQVGACGRTCALLRPGPSIHSGMLAAMSDKWMWQTVSIGRYYDNIAGEVLAGGYNVSPSILQRWEEAVVCLKDRLA